MVMKAGDGAIFEDRRRDHFDPEIVAVFPAAFGDADPRFAALEGPKEVLEHLTWRARVSENALRRAKHFSPLCIR